MLLERAFDAEVFEAWLSAMMASWNEGLGLPKRTTEKYVVSANEDTKDNVPLFHHLRRNCSSDGRQMGRAADIKSTASPNRGVIETRQAKTRQRAGSAFYPFHPLPLSLCPDNYTTFL